MEFIEEVISTSPSRPSAPAAAVSQAWSRLRSARQELEAIDQSLRLLADNKKSLHVGEPQVRFLLALIASLAGDAKSSPEFLAGVRASAALVISVWIRRSLLVSSDRNSSAAATLDSVARVYLDVLQDETMDSCCCQSVLVLGAVCAVRECRSATRRECHTAIVQELATGNKSKRRYTDDTRWLPEVLAGFGYAMIGDSGDFSVCSLVTKNLSALWTVHGSDQCLPPLGICVMLSRLYEIVASSSQHRALESLGKALLVGDAGALPEMENAKVAMAAGLLRGARLLESVRKSLEQMASAVAGRVIDEVCRETGRVSKEQVMQYVGKHQVLKLSDSLWHRLRCIALSIASCREFNDTQPEVLLCLLLVLLEDVLNLSGIYSSPSPGLTEMVCQALKVQVDGALFRGVGSLARTVCEQYRGVHSLYQRQVEALFWRFSSTFYERHRACATKFFPEKLFGEETKNNEVEKIWEATFLTIVLFYSTSIKFLDDREELAAYILDSFSCIEFIRRFHVDEYADTVKKCAVLVSKSRGASAQLVKMLPSYEDVTSSPGPAWCHDKIQTNRIEFYFRVLPSCVQQLDNSSFENHIAPILFLYVCHPSKQVAEAAHHLFASFVSQSADSASEGSLAEQLGVFYINRAMEGYPDFTPLEGLVAGVAEMVRCLPAGSVTIQHCIDQLVAKTRALTSPANLEEEAADIEEAPARIQALLLHLLLIVDIQVLPHLMHELSKLVLLSLPSKAQARALDEAFAVVSDCEDYIRKPTLIAWLQSLAFLQPRSKL